MIAAFVISDRLPLNVDAKDVFFPALLLFITYLAISWLAAGRSNK
jgi:hypothetical protein